jgi:hypothetical protein
VTPRRQHLGSTMQCYKIPLPTCSVCKTPVDTLVEHRNHETGVITLVASCHGEQERVDITIDLQRELDPRTVRLGKAFTGGGELTLEKR